MVKFKLSAFSDEYSPSLDEQIEGLITSKIRMTELRGVDGINVSDLTQFQASDVHKKLESSGISVSAIGSPIGKIKITDPFEPHLDKLKNTCEIADILYASRIRMFSFYIPDGKYDEYKNEVIDRLGKMLDVADEYGVKLCHENEKGIYGDTPERCLEILDEFDGRLGCVFDPANFIQCGQETLSAWEMLKGHVQYLHIKDALSNGTVVPAGKGEGHLTEILTDFVSRGGTAVTIEPHLKVFDGLNALELDSARSAVDDYQYKTTDSAFDAACAALRKVLEGI